MSNYAISDKHRRRGGGTKNWIPLPNICHLLEIMSSAGRQINTALLPARRR